MAERHAYLTPLARSGWQPEGQGFESPWVHFQWLIRTRAREERREDLRELRPADLAILDVDGLEHSVVEATAHRRPRLPVRRVAVAGESDGGAEDVLPAVEVALRRLQLASGRLLGNADAILLRFQEIERDRIRVEGLQELASLFGELGELPRQDDPALGGLGLTLDDLGLQLLGEPSHPRRWQLDSAI